MSSVVRPTGSLKDLLKKEARSTRLMGAVESFVANAPDKPRDQSVLHPSEIVKPDWCHRASYYVLSGRTKTKENISFRLQNTFDEGHAIHDKWQSRFRDMGNLFGKWECLNCGEVWWDTSPLGCQACGGSKRVVSYREISLESDPRLKIAGHADGWIKGIGADCLIEVKSIGFGTVRMEHPRIAKASDGDLEQAWRMIRAPFPSHLKQGNLYLELGRQMVSMGIFDSFPEEIVYLYELKMNQDFKEFVVRREPSVIKPIIIGARDVVRALDKGVPPPCNLDSQLGCSKCRAYEGGN